MYQKFNMKGLLRQIIFLMGVTAVLLLSFPLASQAQYFGRNKPLYKTFRYSVYQTPHFEIYHYLTSDTALQRYAQLCEQWYTLHQNIFKDTFKTPNPIVLYNDHADFQQSTAISGTIGVGTGGVTEALKNRMVLPFAATHAQTDHVLGHEMVHAFQFQTLLRGDSGSYNNLRNIPLWMIEGMAEYLSVGSRDPHTALWMRDAIVNNDFPTLDQMTRNLKYFPYRFGHCFWAMVGKTWGDTAILPIFRQTVKQGYSDALKNVTGYNQAEFSIIWKQALVDHYRKYLDEALTVPSGQKILSAQNAGDVNVSPSISPDGTKVVFLSEKDLLSFDLYLADAQTGKILRKISSTRHSSEVDALNYIESAGTWSPDGKKFAYVVFANGRNKLTIINGANGRVIKDYDIPGVAAFSNPAWSPTGNQIALSGMINGQSHLFLFDIKSRQVTRLTHDGYSYLQPSWSPNGTQLAFCTDKPLENQPPTKRILNIGMMDVRSGEMELINVFASAKNMNPVFSHDGKSVYFLSDRDGFRNLYRYLPDSLTVFQLTKYFTGISGITEYSPAISLASNADKICYSYFFNGKYLLYSATSADFTNTKVRADSVNFEAAILPQISHNGVNIVDNQLNNRTNQHIMPTDSFKTIPFKAKFKLDYVSNINMGAGVGGRLGSGLAGSAYALFSDIVGQRQLFSMVSINGQIYDYGGQIAFMNTKHLVNWGISVSHIPYLYGFQGYNLNDSILVTDPNTSAEVKQKALNYPLFLRRTFEDKISFLGVRPFSQTKRMEFGASTGWYSFRDEVRNQYFDPVSLSYLGSSDNRVKGPDGFNQITLNLAYVFDNSTFGMTGPMTGSRYRIGIDQFMGSYRYTEILVDYRAYLNIKPLTLALRGLHNGRYGTDAEYQLAGDKSQLFNNPYRSNYLSIGYDWYIRGYNYNTFYNKSETPRDTLAISYTDMFGSRIAVFNLELRLPLTGPKRLATIPSKFAFTDFALFCDAGLAWTKDTKPVLKKNREKKSERIPVISVGATLRINVMGYMVIGPYYAFPMQKGGFNNPLFGLTFWPGW